jgi:hypothetical protein
MKKINLIAVLTIINLLLAVTTVAQTKAKPKRPSTRNGVWFSPTRANTINGLSLSSLNSGMFYENDSVKINGLNIEANPEALFIAPYFVIGAVAMLFQDTSQAHRIGFAIPDTLELTKNQINGLSVSFIGVTARNFNGLSISGLINGGDKFNGIAIAGSAKSFYKFNGVSIAGIANNAYKGNGIQIGLFNRCIECKGLQIGLLNKMGKRTLPFINMRFKS